MSGTQTMQQMTEREVVARAAFAFRWPTAYAEIESGVRTLPIPMLREADAILVALSDWRRQR